MTNQLRISRNSQGGIDLTVDDGQHNVQHQTGNPNNSLQYWMQMRRIADDAVAKLQKDRFKQAHIVIVETKNFKDKKTKKMRKSSLVRKMTVGI